MGFFLIKKRDQHLEQLNNTLENSFSGVKADVVKIFEWLKYFHQRNLQQEHVILQLQRQIDQVPKSKEDVKELIDEYYEVEPLKNKVEKMSAKIESLDDNHRILMGLKYKLEELNEKVQNVESAAHLMPKIEEIKSKINNLEDSHAPIKQRVEEHASKLEKLEFGHTNKPIHQQPKTVHSARENLMRKIAKSSKDHVKTILRSLIIKYGQIHALQLREIVVEEQGLCSKSSFYRILEELEQEEDISVLHEKKEKKYIFKAIRVE
tara:strand:+ start:1313 stop:2104 length:792 start_codon:yes stop_codon:yes gene_type:complete